MSHDAHAPGRILPGACFGRMPGRRRAGAGAQKKSMKPLATWLDFTLWSEKDSEVAQV